LKSSSNIKLFIDAHCFDNEFQGTRTFIKEIYRQFCKKTNGIDYYLGAFDIRNLKKEFDFIPSANFIKYKSTNSFIRIFSEIPEILKENKIDVAHFQYISPFRKYCKYIVTTHDILFNDFTTEFSLLYRLSRNFIFKHSIRRADIKTTVSAYSQNRLVHHYGLSKNDLHVVPNGVSEKFYEAYNKVDSQTYVKTTYGVAKFILYVSRVEPRKNNILLLQAYLEAKLHEKGFALVFIGKTSISSEILDDTLIKMPEAAKKLFYRIEQVNENDLLKFYQAAELFVYPSKAEGFGIPPLEAAALEVPVLCSNKTAMSDFAFFDENFFNPENKSELLLKMNRILSGQDKTDYGNISAIIKTKYSWSRSAEILYNLLKNEYVSV